MKKLAIVGSSNSFMNNCYGDIIKNRINNDCDNYSLGCSSILTPVFKLLMQNIINEYSYIVFQFNPAESRKMFSNSINKEIIISYILFILKLLSGSNTKPIFLNMAYLGDEEQNASSYLIRGLSKILNFYLIDLQNEFKFISKKILTKDNYHYETYYQDYIANEVLSIVNNDKLDKYVSPVSIDINFEIFSPTNLMKNIPHKKGTSWFSWDTYELTYNDRLTLPEDKFLCGILYWLIQNQPFLIYHNRNIELNKCLNINHWSNLFLCRTIGHSVYKGLRGGYLSVSRDIDHTITERTDGAMPELKDDHSGIFIATLLMSNLPPVIYGEKFYKIYENIFLKEQDFIAKIENERFHINEC